MDYFGTFLLREVELIDTLEGIIYVSATVLALLLLALSISAYRNTGIKKIKYAIAAFALFAAYLFWEYLEGVFIFLGKKCAVDVYCWLHKGAYACSKELCLGIETDA